jgi:Cys-tRNA(Pro) deacylase
MHRNVRQVVEAARLLGIQIHPREFPDGTRTAADAALAIGVDLGQIVKSLVFAVDDEVVVALVSGDNLLHEEKLARCAGGTRAWREDAETVREATGYPVGGVPPFGHREPLRVFIDEDLMTFDELWAAAGTPHWNFAITPDELARATVGVVCDLAQRR